MLSEEQLNELRQKYESIKYNKTKERMFHNGPLLNLIHDSDTNQNDEFNIEINTHGVSNQFSTGRCWIFSGLNILREHIINSSDLDSVKLSGSYLAFYDKLERFNFTLEKIISYKEKGKTIYDDSISDLLWDGIKDEGYFMRFVDLIEKYGIVPEKVYPETYSSAHTTEVNDILSRLIRLFYLELEKGEKDKYELLNNYLEKAYTIMCNLYGNPPKTFDFEGIDIDGDFFIERDLTPKEFYDEYIGFSISKNYVEVTSYEDEKISYYNRYQKINTSKMSEKSDYTSINLPYEEMKELVLKQLKSGEPVCFYCCLPNKKIDGVWLDELDRYGDIFEIDLRMDRNEFYKTNGFINGHCMLITGAREIDGVVSKWKVENSWGPEYGKGGYYTALDDWFRNHVFRVVINKKHLTKEQLDVSKKRKIKIKAQDAKY